MKLVNNSVFTCVKTAIVPAVVFCWACFFSTAAQAEERLLLDLKVKAAYIYNFCKFVEWPDAAFKNTDNTLSICILGDDPFGNLFDPVIGEPAQGRRIVIKRSKFPEDAKDCQVVFVCSSEKDRLIPLLKSLASTNSLTISDIDGFAEHGGIVGFFKADDRVRFKINLAAAQKSGLRFSSMIIEIATLVDENHKRK